jgi:hypothetical protein
MATDKRFVVKNGLQTENINFVFNDAVLGSSNITATMLSSNTLSFSGSTGQLFSITDSMTGVIFAVNDISGVPSIEVFDDGRVYFAETFGNVTIGNSAISSSRTSTSTTTGILQVAGGVGITGNINAGGTRNLFTGSVGIGTSTPLGTNANVFSVYGSAMVYGNLDLANPAGGTSGIYFNDGTYQTTAFTGAATPSFGPTGTVQFAGAGNTFSGNGDLFFWDTANSRLGIGTNSPTNVLTVRSTATPAWFNTLNSAVSSNNFEIIVGNGASTGTTVGYVNNTLVPYGYISTGTNTRNITVAANGRVGIGGVTAPQVLLDVGGGAVVGASWAGNSNFINPPANGLAVQGSVGIGTYTPLSTLDVRGGVGVTAASNFGGAVSVASLTSNGAVSGTTGTFSGDVSIADKIVHTGDTDTAIRFPANDTFTVETAGNERFRIDVSGNVGIGETNPTQALIIRRPGSSVNLILQADTQTNMESSIRFNSGISTLGGEIKYIESANRFLINASRGSTSSRSIQLQLGNTTYAGLYNEGRFGIGTDTPGSLLDVNGIASFRSAVSVAGQASIATLVVNTGTYTNSLNVNTTANVNALTSNTGITVSAGGVTVTGLSRFTGNVSIAGNLNVTGAIYTDNANVLVVQNPIIYVGEDNPADLFDLGIVGSYTSTQYFHTGFVRNKDDDTWTLFDTLPSEPNAITGTVDWSNSWITFGRFKTGNIIVAGNATSTSSADGTVVINGVGGLGVGGNVNVGGQRSVFSGNILIQGTNASTSTSTGAFIVTNGVGIGGAVHIGGVIYGASTLNIAGAAQVNSLVSNGAISGTTGTFSGDLSIADKIVHTGDTDTAIRFPAADTFTIETAGNERLRVTSTGLVGIGSTSPTKPLDVLVSDTMRVYSPNSGHIGINLQHTGTNGRNFRLASYADATAANSSFRIRDDSAGADRFVVDLNGQVGIATTNPLSTLDVRGGVGVTAAANFGGALSAFSLTSNSTITGANYLVTTASSSTASGAAIQRVFTKTVAATELYNLATFAHNEGVVAIEIQVASNTSSNSGTATYRFQGGYSSLTGSYYRLMPFNDGRGHGEGPDTGFSTTAWEVYIYGTTVSGGPTTYGVAVSVPSGAATKTLITTITELRRGMTFTDRSADAVVTSFTNSGNIYSHRNLLIENRVGIATTAPGSTLDVNGVASFRSAISVASTATVSSLTSNGAITGTTITGTAATLTSSQNSGNERAANIVSNTWIHATQNLTVASSNTSTTTATGAVVVTGGVGIGGNINVGGTVNSFAGDVGIGTISPVSQLHVTTNGTAANRGLTVGQHNTGAQAALLNFRKSRGTISAPTTVATNDYTGAFTFLNYDGAAYRNNAGFGARITGTVANNSVPTDIFFWAGATDDSDPYNNNTVRMVIANTGRVGIGTASPGSTLDVNGIASIRSAMSVAGTATVNALVSNGTITGTAATFTSSQNSGNERAAEIVSNTWIHATQNLTVASSNASTSTTTGAAVVTGGVGIGGNLNVGGTRSLFTGRVGVGTTNAATVSNTFAVFGSTNITGNVVLANPAGGTGGIYFPDGTYQTTAITSQLMSSYEYTGDGTTTVYSTAPSTANGIANTIVFVNGVYQLKDAYTWSGTSLTFVTPPPANSLISINIVGSVAASSTTSIIGVTTVTGNTTLLPTTPFAIVSGNSTVTLPSAATSTGQMYYIKNVGTGNVVVTTINNETIDGDSSLIINSQWSTAGVLSNGTNWFIF